jgi:hypothetical protein
LPQAGQTVVSPTLATLASDTSAGSAAPQLPQNRESCGSWLPHVSQVTVVLLTVRAGHAWPQLVQNFPPGRRSAPQFSQ